ncbi:MAG TPA: GAF domain-containing protein [Terriglobales bacterium]|nr:GAF domain-containing protein [Terriglobales bacterium]
MLTEVVDRLCSLTRADGAAIALCDPRGVVCRASAGNAPDVGSRLQADSGLTRECFESGQVVFCEDAEKDPRVRLAIVKSLRLRSAVVVPIEAEGPLVGVVEVLSSRPSAFDQTHVAALNVLLTLLRRS